MPRSFLIRKKTNCKLQDSNRSRTQNDVIAGDSNDVVMHDVIGDDNQCIKSIVARVETFVPPLLGDRVVVGVEARKEIWSPITTTDSQRRVGADDGCTVVSPAARGSAGSGCTAISPAGRVSTGPGGMAISPAERASTGPGGTALYPSVLAHNRFTPLLPLQHHTGETKPLHRTNIINPSSIERIGHSIEAEHKSIPPFIYPDYFQSHPLTPSPTNIPLISYMYSPTSNNYHSYDAAEIKQFTREARPLFASGKTSPFFSSLDSPDSSSQRPQSSMIPSPVDSLVTLISASDFSPNGRSRGSSGGDSTSERGRSTSSSRQHQQPQRRSNSFQDGITVGYTYDAFFISDGRTRRRQQPLPSTASPSSASAAPAEVPTLSGGPLEPIRLQRYKCSECGKHYATSSNLSRHKQTHRSLESQQAKQCPHCRKVYVSMPALSMHILTHDLKYQCTVCSKAFSRPWLLQGHLRSHSGEKPYGCTHCGRAFADRSNLRAHMQTHSAYKMYTCLRCNKSFALKAYLNKHLESACFKDDEESCSSMTSIWSV